MTPKDKRRISFSSGNIEDKDIDNGEKIENSKIQLRQPVVAFHIYCGSIRDLPALSELEQRCFSDPWSESALSAALEHPNYIVLCARKDVPADTRTLHQKPLAGLMIASIAADECSIQDVAVAPVFRRQGLGLLLFQSMEKQMTGRGSKFFFLEVRESNRPARRLYEKMGYHAIGTRRRYYQNPEENAVIMFKDINNTENKGDQLS